MGTTVCNSVTQDKFAPVRQCWICGGEDFVGVHRAVFDFALWHEQDPELADYTGATVILQRCRCCGFGQPEALPTLPNFFDRMYDQRWSDEWLEAETESQYKDKIFRSVLADLDRRQPKDSPRRLLDVGAHVGRFMELAQQRGWQPEGVELNPRTAACAARRTGLPIHHINAHELVLQKRQYQVITLIDVLEHIPEPLALLKTLRDLLAPGGWLAVKVPHGPNQLRKELLRARLRPSHRATVADNLVHVNHFTPASLRRALITVGLTNCSVEPGAPELLPLAECNTISQQWNYWFRSAVYHTARALPFGAHTPLAMNLQAYAQKPGDDVT